MSKKKSKEKLIQTIKGPAIYGEERLSTGNTIYWVRYLDKEPS